MTPEQFVLWMQGFIEGSNAYNLTPAGWDTVKAKLKEVTPVAKKTFKPLPHPSCPWAGRDDKTPLNQEGPPWPQIYPTAPPYRYKSPSLPDEMFRVTCGSGEEPSTWKYYNNGVEVPASGVTWEDKVSEKPVESQVSVYEQVLANPKLCKHYDKDGNVIGFRELKKPTPPPDRTLREGEEPLNPSKKSTTFNFNPGTIESLTASRNCQLLQY